MKPDGCKPLARPNKSPPLSAWTGPASTQCSLTNQNVCCGLTPVWPEWLRYLQWSFLALHVWSHGYEVQCRILWTKKQPTTRLWGKQYALPRSVCDWLFFSMAYGIHPFYHQILNACAFTFDFLFLLLINRYYTTILRSIMTSISDTIACPVDQRGLTFLRDVNNAQILRPNWKQLLFAQMCIRWTFLSKYIFSSNLSPHTNLNLLICECAERKVAQIIRNCGGVLCSPVRLHAVASEQRHESQSQNCQAQFLSGKRAPFHRQSSSLACARPDKLNDFVD